jgi:hypothetical protein
MKNNDKLKQLSNIIKNARKNSLIGEYGNSLEKYQEAIAIIKERQEEIINEGEDLKEKWKMTEYNIKSEMLQIKNVLETCLQLHHSHFNYSKKQLEGDEFINENKKKVEKEILEFYNKDKDKRIYEPKKNNNNKNITKNRSYKEKDKNKIYKNKFNLIIDTKKNNKAPKVNPWLSNKNSNKNSYISNYNKFNNTDNNMNIKKCKSLKVNTIEKKMFNPLEEFYSKKNDNKNKEININGKDNSNICRKSLQIQQKLSPSSFDAKPNIKVISNSNNNNINYNSNVINNKKKQIKVVQIDLDNLDEKKNDLDIKGVNFEENLDMVEQALKNLSQLNLDNNDSF